MLLLRDLTFAIFPANKFSAFVKESITTEFLEVILVASFGHLHFMVKHSHY